MAQITEDQKSNINSYADTFHFKLRNVPNDHSCLFHSIGYSIDNAKYSKDIDFHYELRQIVSTTIVEQQAQYKPDLVAADKNAKEYSLWIKDQFSWGGTLDATILSKHFNLDIVVIDVTANTYYSLNPPQHNEAERDRIYIIYNGDHYDSAVGIYDGNGDLDVSKEIRKFNLNALNKTTAKTFENWADIDEHILKPFLNKQHAEYKKKKSASDKLKSLKKYKCQDCNTVFDLQGMNEHMKSTSFDHCMFDEI